ncbi:MAG TPA: hypothetical protein VH208_03755 [Myxococcaceae bacterium]|jgi:hypothetical protein|nr:hypothetical protein [Myxococcaceae bacterium]
MSRYLVVSAFVAVLGSGASFAQDAGPAEGGEPAALVTRYLTLVKAKKWSEAKKLLHPKTLDAIAERKKRLGKEDHPMAPQGYEKTESYLTGFRITGSKPGPLGTEVVETSEDNYQVEEKGTSEGDVASYLVGRFQGKWYLVDKKRGGEAFTKDSVKYGYKGYFDPPPASGE